MSADGLSGVDLARVALMAALENGRNNNPDNRPATRKPTHRRSSRRDGRDPMALGSALNRLVTERGWERPATGGSVLNNWKAIARADETDLAEHVTAVHFDDITGQLDLAADSHPWATQARLISHQLVKRANEFIQSTTRHADPHLVRVIKVMVEETGARPRRPAEEQIPPQAGDPPPAPTPVRSAPPEGYRAAKALVVAHKLELPADPHRAHPASRLTGSARFREPESVFADLVDLHTPVHRPESRPTGTDTPS